MTDATPIFAVNALVRDRADRNLVGPVLRVAGRYSGEFWYTVQFGPTRLELPESRLEPFDGGEDLNALFSAGRFGNKDALTKCVTFSKLRKPLRNNLYALRASRTQFHAHQFKPLLKFLDSPGQRLLIADEVGLGKTIEAGFILRELRVRQSTRRVLIVCPSALCRKWQDELARRFDEQFQILDSAAMRAFLKKAEEQPERASLQGIIPLQCLRARALLEQLEAIRPWFDFVVVDEAHHMRNSGTLANQLGRLLSECADAMLLLTATPIHLGNQNLFQLLHILDPEQFSQFELFERRLETNRLVLEADRALRLRGDPSECKRILLSLKQTPERVRFERNPYYQDLLAKLDECDPGHRDQLVEIQRDLSKLNLLSHILTRTRKREVDESRPQRTARVIPVRFTHEELEFYRRATDLCIAWYEAQGESWAARFAALSLQRQIASCLPAFRDHNLDPSRQSDGVPTEDDFEDVAPEDWGLEEEVSPDQLRTAQLRLVGNPAFRRVLREYAEVSSLDSKYETLRRELAALDRAEPGRKLIIFSYFKKTLAYLSRRLAADGYRTVLLTGDVPSRPADPERDERAQTLRAFQEDPNIRILLSSEVGSEGLDFQFCHILINYDLPWNPMVVEQRIGRLDRLGQKAERILILNFSVEGTIEEKILERLYQRIGIFEGSIGDLEPILGQEIRHLTDELLRSRLSDSERASLIEERARVLVHKKLESERLENEAIRFLAQDEFFNDEIARVQKYRRYLSPEEIELFVSDYLRDHQPRCSLRATKPDGCYWLTVSSELQQAVRQCNRRDDPLLNEFLVRSDGGGLTVTFKPEIACNTPEAVLISSQHPLVRAIVDHYEKHPNQIHPVAKLQVACPGVPALDYVFQVQLLEVRGAEPGLYLDPIFVPVNGGPALDPERSDLLLSRMLVAGCDWLEELKAFDPGQVAAWEDALQSETDRRITDRRLRLEKRNTAIIESRLASIAATFEFRRNRHLSLLARAEQQKRKENFLRMLRGGLRNLENDYRQRKEELERGRRLELQLQRFAMGIVRVVDHDVQAS